MRRRLAVTAAALASAAALATLPAPAAASDHPCHAPIDFDCYDYNFEPPHHCDIYIFIVVEICVQFPVG